MKSSVIGKGLLVFAVLATLVFEVFSTMMVVHMIGEGWIDGLVDFVMITAALVSPIIVLAGLYLTRRSPVLGGALVIGGVITMGGIFIWFPPFWVLAGAVAVIGFFRARRLNTARIAV